MMYILKNNINLKIILQISKINIYKIFSYAVNFITTDFCLKDLNMNNNLLLIF